MTGPEHYLLAENSLTILLHDGHQLSDEARTQVIAEGQIHAALAVAAATALGAGSEGLIRADEVAWLNAASAHVRPGGTA